jgi:hypothetical protein
MEAVTGHLLGFSPWGTQQPRADVFFQQLAEAQTRSETERQERKEHFLVFINHKHSSLKYLLFVANRDTNVKAMLDAWARFQEEFGADQDDWLLSSSEVSLNEEGSQHVARLD